MDAFMPNTPRRHGVFSVAVLKLTALKESALISALNSASTGADFQLDLVDQVNAEIA